MLNLIKIIWAEIMLNVVRNDLYNTENITNATKNLVSLEKGLHHNFKSLF